MSEVPSLEQLLAVVGELSARNAEQAGLIDSQAGVIEGLRVQVAELQARLGQNSRNSSVPPSADGLAKPAPKSRRTRTGRKPGGQPGHPGTTLRQVAVPDEVVVHEPVCCAGCGAGLADARRTGCSRRQVFDLPPVTVRVIEHQLVERTCGCGTATRALAPQGVSAAPVSYGPRIAAVILYLYVGQFLSQQRTADALAELFGVPLSPGTVGRLTERAVGTLTGSGLLELIGDRIAGAPVAHFDETGLRVAGALHWVHSASTGKYSLITCHRRRGVLAMDAAGVLPRFTGVAVHDAWAPYDTYTGATHALCGAHVLRELTAVIDLAPTEGFCWARQAHDALIDLKGLADTAAAAGLAGCEPQALARHTRLLRSAASIGVSQNAHRTGKLISKHHALASRLLARQDDSLRFTADLAVPMDNNAAEREIRMIKVRQKVSGCLRTLSGAEAFCALRSYLATARKHDTHFFDALTQLAQGQPWQPAPT